MGAGVFPIYLQRIQNPEELTPYRLILSLALFLCTVFTSKAQQPAAQVSRSNLRTKTIQVSGDSLILDTLSILPRSFSINEVDTAAYRLDFVNAMLYWKLKPERDSISVLYRVFPYKLNAVVQRYSFDSVAKNLYLKPFEFDRGGETAS
jgi:hypothetical protein